MKNNKKGFTLIELLVVVLIIGILASIALPQYFKAVEKSKSAEALSLFGSIAGAQQRYFLVKDAFTEDFDDLDLDFTNSDGSSPTESSLTTKNFVIYLKGTSSGTGHVKAVRGSGRYQYRLCKNYDTGAVVCASDTNICASLGIGTGTCTAE